MAYTKYSLTPANNNATPPDGAPEGMLPSAVNDTMRDMMAQIRDVGDGIRNGTYTMTAPVITGGSITGVALSGNTFTNPVITGGSINNTPIGASTASTGAFTTLSASGATTFSGAVVMSSTFAANGGATLGDASGDALTINSSAVSIPNGLNFDSNTFVIDATNNRVGINTSSPASILDVAGSASGAYIAQILRNTNSGGYAQQIFQIGSTNGTANVAYAPGIFFTLGPSANDTTTPIVFQNNNATERMRISSTGNVSIGTTSTPYVFYVNASTANDVVAQIQNTNANGYGLKVVNPNTSNYALAINDNVTGNTVTFYSDGRMSSKLGIGVGDVVPATSGAGIFFPATQSASSNANCLDDYEEGTFGPTALGQTSAGTTTYLVQTGTYTKIGRQVTVGITLAYSALTGTGNLRIGNLPFTNGSNEYVGSIMVDGLNWGGGTQITPWIGAGDNSFALYYFSDDSAWATQQCTNETVSMRITATYFV